MRERLHERVSGAAGNDLEPALAAVSATRQQATEAGAQLDRFQRQLAPLFTAQNDRLELERNEDQWRELCASFPSGSGDGLQLAALSAIRAGDLSAGEDSLRALRTLWTAATDLVAVLRTDTSDARLSEVRAQARRADETAEAMRAGVILASAQEEQARVLQRATTRAVTAVTEKRFKRLAPTVQDIYWRLDPHSSFKTLDFDVDVYRQKGIATPIVRDETEAVDADPLLVFSSSQANVTALSYFLALGWAAGRDSLSFVLLDDPLQSMDDVNSLGFADLCRHIRRQRQLVVSTHERRLASLLERKLAPRSTTEQTRVVEFKAWTRDGPEIDQRVVEPQLHEGEHRSVVSLNAA